MDAAAAAVDAPGRPVLRHQPGARRTPAMLSQDKHDDARRGRRGSTRCRLLAQMYVRGTSFWLAASGRAPPSPAILGAAAFLSGAARNAATARRRKGQQNAGSLSREDDEEAARCLHICVDLGRTTAIGWLREV